MALGAWSCAPKVVEYQVKIVTTSCDSSSDPFAGAQFLTVRVTGDGISPPLEVNSEAASLHVTLPEIPAGPNRVVQVRVFGADGVGGRVLSWGQSVPFDVPDLVPDVAPPAINVFLRKVNGFTPLASIGSLKDCARMKVPRAGHTATLLPNGKVFITGGYRLKEGTVERIALSDTELYNPQTGAFESARSMSIGSQFLPSAFHTATLIASDQVLLWGGEQYINGAANVPAPRASAIIYDPGSDLYRGVPSRATPKNIVRSHHSAAVDKNGKVLIVGGQSRDDANQLAPADKVEWYDPASAGTFVVDALTLVRLEASVAPIQGGALIAVAGGSDGATLQRDISYFGFDGSAFKLSGQGPQLQSARRAAAAATSRSGDDLLIFGGYGDLNNVAPLSTTEVVATRANSAGPGPSVGSRGDACTATLPDGTVLVIGGRTIDALGQPAHSDASVILVKPLSSGGYSTDTSPSLNAARYSHTCTALADGSVLVTGGVRELSGNLEVLQDALIYQPPPPN